jgi:protein phosphatase 2C
MWVANAGDSRTILVKKDSVVQVTTDHKPNEPNEKARILAAGGSIIFYGVWRVNGALLPLFTPSRVPTIVSGMLATSRGFGDASLKPVVLATPEIFPRSKEADDVAIVRILSFLVFLFTSFGRFFVPMVCLTLSKTTKSAL